MLFDTKPSFFLLFFHLFIYSLAALHSMWDLSSLTRDQTHTLPCSGRQIFNRWTTREFSTLGNLKPQDPAVSFLLQTASAFVKLL